MNFAKGGPAELSNGLYLKPVIEYGAWERPWKIDMWALPVEVAEKKQSELRNLQARLSPELRRLILEYKFSVLTDAGRTPMFSGIHIYRAVIIQGLTDHEAITEYLRKNGIEI